VTSPEELDAHTDRAETISTLRAVAIPRAGVDARMWLALACLCLLFFGVELVAVKTGWSVREDTALERGLHHTLGLETFPFFTAVSLVGGPTFRAIEVSVAAIVCTVYRRWISVALLLTSVGGAAALEVLVKVIVARPRPYLFRGAQHAAGFSFPSGHAMSAAAFCGALAFIAWHAWRRALPRTLAVSTAILAAFLVGLSRIVLGVHYPSDVLGGFTLAVAWTSLCIACFSRQLVREQQAVGKPGREERVLP